MKYLLQLKRDYPNRVFLLIGEHLCRRPHHNAQHGYVHNHMGGC